jgi:hypothetical protein
VLRIPCTELLLAAMVASCAVDWARGPMASSADAGTTETGVSSTSISLTPEPEDLGAPCDIHRSVESGGPALLVRDAAVLERFSLERVLKQIVASSGATMAPGDLLQRLFDTENTSAAAAFADVTHCDDPMHPAFRTDQANSCARAEGRLATSTGLLVAGDPDSFDPVAIVNRFDLMPSDRSTCGEYRIVYAKRSGRTDTANRAFLIFESALINRDVSLAGCRPVAEFWAALEGVPTATLADRLETFFFQGIGKFLPAVNAAHYGINQTGCGYAGVCGQIRLGQGMQGPFEFRQFHLAKPLGTAQPSISVLPMSDTLALRPELFDGATPGSIDLFQSFFGPNTLAFLVSPEITRITLLSSAGLETGESAVDGQEQPNYEQRVTASAAGPNLTASIKVALDSTAPKGCPVSDPLTPASILRRTSGLSCAGCHAPEKVLPPDRAVGCGQVWPKSLGQVHIDEQGNLSPALTDVFLPHRADVFSTYLRACDAAAVRANLQVVPPHDIVECFPAGTPITMADGSPKAIEQIDSGEEVASFDADAYAVVPGRVVRRIVRPFAPDLVVINGSLTATGNHTFYTARGWVRADELELGDSVMTVGDAVAASEQLSAEPSSIRSLEARPGSETTYDLEIETHHTYFAGGLLVHDRP